MGYKDNRKELVERVAKDIEAGKPFFWDKGHYGRLPYNPSSETIYRGANRVQLMLDSKEKGFTDSRWMTFNQAKKDGLHVKKGEHGSNIEFWSFTEEIKVPNKEKGIEEKLEVPRSKPLVKTFKVFNAQQIEGIPPEHPVTISEAQRNEFMENMLKHSEATIFFDEASRNYYSPGTDEIHVLPREKFKDLDSFYATCVHEIAHSTGHKDRLARGLENPEDKAGYAKEELRAELASMFITQDWGLSFDESHYQNHAAYLQSWAKALKEDPNEFYRASADAQKIADYIEEKMILKELDINKVMNSEQKDLPEGFRKLRQRCKEKLEKTNLKEKVMDKGREI